MNSRQRFLETMAFGTPDHAPLFHEGIRGDVLEAWSYQGLDKGGLSSRFNYDRREEFEPEFDPLPPFSGWPTSDADLKQFERHLDPNDPQRLPKNWKQKVLAWRRRDHPLILRAHPGFFVSMGVEGWGRFSEVNRLLVDDPEFVGEIMAIQCLFAATLLEKILNEVEVDAVIFEEPISGNHGPLISPGMYEEFALRSYQHVLEVLEKYRVQTIIMRTYANNRILLPHILKTRSTVSGLVNATWSDISNPSHIRDANEIKV